MEREENIESYVIKRRSLLEASQTRTFRRWIECLRTSPKPDLDGANKAEDRYTVLEARLEELSYIEKLLGREISPIPSETTCQEP